MSEADDRFLESLAAELQPRLGPRLPILGLDLDRPAADRVGISVSVASSVGPQSFVEEGDTLTDVAARLLQRAAEFRLADGFRELTGPTRG